MSNVVPNKVDMSLDDIIKLSKSEKRKQTHITKRRGRGNGAPSTGGISRGRAGAQNRGRGTGRGRGVTQSRNYLKQFHTNLPSRKRGQGRGRGRGINRQTSGISQLNQNNTNQQNVQGRGRGRGRGRRGAGLVFTNSRVRQQSVQLSIFSQQQSVLQRERLNKVREQAALLKEKQLAIKNLQQAQKNVQTINLAIQKTSRENIVNQLRGINNVQTGQPGTRGRRKLALLKRQGNSNLLNLTSPSRQLSHTSVTIANTSAVGAAPTSLVKRRRKWRSRRNNNNQAASQHFTIQVANQNPNLQPVIEPQNDTFLNQLKLLKPTVTTTYKFQKSVFAAPSTSLSLNDRFSGTSSYSDAGDSVSEGRKVFI